MAGKINHDAPAPIKVKKLTLRRETVQDLSETQAEAVNAGRRPRTASCTVHHVCCCPK